MTWRCNWKRLLPSQLGKGSRKKVLLLVIRTLRPPPPPPPTDNIIQQDREIAKVKYVLIRLIPPPLLVVGPLTKELFCGFPKSLQSIWTRHLCWNTVCWEVFHILQLISLKYLKSSSLQGFQCKLQRNGFSRLTFHTHIHLYIQQYFLGFNILEYLKMTIIGHIDFVIYSLC